jgi:glycosyltransferase involved in cell wall biosynthesis
MTVAAPPLRVLLLARYGLMGASSRVRHYSYLDDLTARGIVVETDHLIDDDSLQRFYAGRSRRWDRIGLAYVRRILRLRNLNRYDLVWIEKEALPGLPWALERWFYGRVPTLVDLDDLWIARFAHAPGSREAIKFGNLLRAADGVTTANVHLAEAIASFCGRRSQVLENAINVDGYRQAASRAVLTADRLPRIGWLGTPVTANAYLPAVAPVLNRLTAEGCAVTRLIGAGTAVPELVAERIPWTLDGEQDAAASLDIGIMPLSQTAFDASKSGWKLVQCMAAGRPVVATRIGFNADLIEDGVTGFLVDHLTDFEQRLRLLIADPLLRAAMGRAAQAAIARRFDRAPSADALARMLRAISNRGRS